MTAITAGLEDIHTHTGRHTNISILTYYKFSANILSITFLTLIKPKEIIFDLRKVRAHDPVIIGDSAIEQVLL